MALTIVNMKNLLCFSLASMAIFQQLALMMGDLGLTLIMTCGMFALMGLYVINHFIERRRLY